MTYTGDTTIGTKTARAALWSLLATVATRLISLVALIILARILAPRDFGLLTFALVYITYIETVGDLGTGLALIYWPDRKEDAAQVTFWINVVSGLWWFALTLLLAPQIADFFNSPRAVGIVRLLAWSFPIKYLGNTHDALAQKELRFRDRVVPELGMALGKALLSISLARAGFGATSLAAGHLAGLVFWTVLLWMTTPWRPRLRFPKDLLGPMLAYGRGLIAVNVLAAIVHHADFAIVGRMLGATVLGIYQIAARVPEMTITVLIWVAGRILFPAFAAVYATGADLKTAYLASIRYMTLATLPAAFGLAATAEPFIVAFFGEKWLPSVPVLRALAIYAGLRALSAPGGDLLKAIGRSGLLAKLGIVKAMILLPALIAAGTQDATTVALALVIVTLLTTLLSLGVAGVLLKVTTREFGGAIRVSGIGGAVLLLVLITLGRLIDSSAPVELLVLIPSGAVAYTATVMWLDPEALREARRKLRKRRKFPEADFLRLGRFLVPVRAEQIKRYFLDNLFVAHRRSERLLRAVAPTLLLRSRDAGAALEDVIPPEGRDLLADLTGDRKFRPIVLTDYSENKRSRTVLFLFNDGNERPFAVAKLRPVAATGPALTREWDALKFMQALPRDIRELVPQPLEYRNSSHWEAILMSHLPGRSAYLEMHEPLRRRHVDRHFEAAAAWLSRLHLVTRLGSHCIVHGDFWARNLLTLGEARVSGVVDWEQFTRSGSPFEDLFQFPLTYGLSYPWHADALAAFQNTFIRETPVWFAVRRYLEHYAKATGTSFDELRAGFETYLLARGSTEKKLPWHECLQILATANRSVFSG